MTLFRYGRNEYKKQQKRLILAVAGSIGVIFILLIFGLPLLVNFSILVDTLRGKSPVTSQANSVLLPPVLDPLPIATNSAVLTILGQGTPQKTVIIYINDMEAKRLTIEDDGKFQATILGKTGSNSIGAKVEDNNLTSELSNLVTTSIINNSPTLEITSPQDNAVFAFENNSVDIEGKTDIGNTVSINGRIVIVGGDGTFRMTMLLQEGENIINIEAKDIAGNITSVERRVKYEK